MAAGEQRCVIRITKPIRQLWGRRFSGACLHDWTRQLFLRRCLRNLFSTSALALPALYSTSGKCCWSSDWIKNMLTISLHVLRVPCILFPLYLYYCLRLVLVFAGTCFDHFGWDRIGALLILKSFWYHTLFFASQRSLWNHFVGSCPVPFKMMWDRLA